MRISRRAVAAQKADTVHGAGGRRAIASGPMLVSSKTGPPPEENKRRGAFKTSVDVQVFAPPPREGTSKRPDTPDGLRMKVRELETR